MLTVGAALLQGTKLLEEAAIIAPRLTAEVLLAHALGRERPYLYAHATDELTELAWIHYGRYLKERLDGKPTQYITRRQEFYGRTFRVTPGVLIPRPETEHVVEAAIARIRPGDCILDAGTGSGAIAVTLALETAGRIAGSDLSPEALAVARSNGRGLGSNVQWFCADLLSGVRNRSLDVLVSNPPYIPLSAREGLQREIRDYEPALALFGGDSGLEIYGRLTVQAEQALRPGGWLILELGYTSVEGVTAMLRAGWAEVAVGHDLAGLPRVLTARRSS